MPWFIEVRHTVTFDPLQLTELEERLMATFDEVKAIAIQNRDAAVSANERLDAVNAKIDELRALVNAGSPVSQEQLDELAGLVGETAAALSGVAADLDDAEQS